MTKRNFIKFRKSTNNNSGVIVGAITICAPIIDSLLRYFDLTWLLIAFYIIYAIVIVLLTRYDMIYRHITYKAFQSEYSQFYNITVGILLAAIIFYRLFLSGDYLTVIQCMEEEGTTHTRHLFDQARTFTADALIGNSAVQYAQGNPRLAATSMMGGIFLGSTIPYLQNNHARLVRSPRAHRFLNEYIRRIPYELATDNLSPPTTRAQAPPTYMFRNFTRRTPSFRCPRRDNFMEDCTSNIRSCFDMRNQLLDTTETQAPIQSVTIDLDRLPTSHFPSLSEPKHSSLITNSKKLLRRASA
jgi:hypothetical protein